MSPAIKAVLIFQVSSRSVDDPQLCRTALEKIESLFPGVPLYTNSGLPGEREGRPVNGNVSECLEQVLKATAQEDQDSVALFHDFCPFLDPQLAGEMQEMHFRYLAHYTYPENIPAGFTPDFASLEFLEALGEKRPADMRDFIFKNINDYDVEIFFKLPDLRQLRLDLSCASSRSRLLAARIHDLRPDLSYERLPEFLGEHPELLRPFPSYLEIEITGESPVHPVFLPKREGRSAPRLEKEDLFRLADQVVEEGMEDDLTVAFGGPGEPLLHPDLIAILERWLSLAQVRRIYLETYGVHFDTALVDRLKLLPHPDKLHVIFRLTTLRPERYESLYGAPLLKRVLDNIRMLEDLPPDGRPFAFYVEMIRMKEVADEIDGYFERFEKSPAEVLLQKYNSYAGRLPERRAADLTPLNRAFCWHLARDLYISAEGMIPLCKQDPFAEGEVALDYRSTAPSEFIRNTNIHFISSYRGRHEEPPLPCPQCDEWYTFNG